MNAKKLNRKIHYWGAIVCAIPLVVITITGILLLLKKESDWIQPPSAKGSSKHPSIAFAEVLNSLQNAHHIRQKDWLEIKRIDVRPNKGILKIQLKNQWEIQMDHATGEILHTAFRRSDIIESIHDGSFFHKHVKLWVFLPTGLILLGLWITGLYLFVITEMAKYRSRKKNKQFLHSKKNQFSTFNK